MCEKCNDTGEIVIEINGQAELFYCACEIGIKKCEEEHGDYEASADHYIYYE